MFERIKGFPDLFQAGMGARVSTWWMARTVSMLGGLGIVSSVGLRTIIVEAVREGNKEVIEMAKKFPFPGHIEELLVFAPGGKWHERPVPMDQLGPGGGLATRLATIASFVEVSLAKQGHKGKIGINVMWKLTPTVLPSIYGAMLAGVDALICGAGVPMELPAIVNGIRSGQHLSFSPLSGTKTNVLLEIVPGTVELLASLEQPLLIPILSNFVFCRKIKDEWEKNFGIKPDFFILEDYKAGGHNAPPRDKKIGMHIPERDSIDTYFDDVLKMGIPIIVAGSFTHGGTREDLLYWKSRRAHGIQVGSRFALCSDSGMSPKFRHQIIENNVAGITEILTCYDDSPTGFPIKRVSLPGTLSNPEVYAARERTCKHGYLRQTPPHENDGIQKEVLVCPAMPLAQFMALNPDKTKEQCEAICEGKICLCESLLATIGLISSPAYVTLGESGSMVKEEQTARQIVEEILTPELVAKYEIALRAA